MTAIEKWANDRSLNLWNALSDQELQSSLQKKTATGVRSFVSAINQAREIAGIGGMMDEPPQPLPPISAEEALFGDETPAMEGISPVTPVLRSLLNTSGYVDMLKAENSEEALGRLENLQELLNVTTEYDATSEGPSYS